MPPTIAGSNWQIFWQISRLNEIKNKYVVKVNLDNNSYLLYRKFLFLDHNSLYLSVKVQFLNLIISIVIFLIFIIWIYQLKKN